MIPVRLLRRSGMLYLDTIPALDTWRISCSSPVPRLHFLVDVELPSVRTVPAQHHAQQTALRALHHAPAWAEARQTIFFRDLIAICASQRSSSSRAPGIRGLVVLVFTLPSYPTSSRSSGRLRRLKNMDRATVKRKYLYSCGGWTGSDGWPTPSKFSNVALPAAIPDLILQLQGARPSIAQMIISSISSRSTRPCAVPARPSVNLGHRQHLPGDMLWKNFGVTRYGRVVFYDYDEIEYATDCNFRKIPHAQRRDGNVRRALVLGRTARRFPEEFATFLLGQPGSQRPSSKHHHPACSTPVLAGRPGKRSVGGTWAGGLTPIHELPSARFSRNIRTGAEARPRPGTSRHACKPPASGGYSLPFKVKPVAVNPGVEAEAVLAST